MVNATVIVSATAVVIGAAVAIFLYMKANGLTTENTSLVDACVGALGADDESCLHIADMGYDWDSEVPCWEGDDAAPSWNFKELADAIELDYSENEGSDEFVMENAANYLLTACTAPHSTDRARQLTGHESRRLNWGPCSTDLDFLMGGADTAECSGAAVAIGAGSCQYGQSQVNTWRSRNHWMYQGCLNHDVCLVKGGPGYPGVCGSDCSACWSGGNGGYSGAGYSRGVRDCDGALAGAAKKCAYESCGKGCSRPCKDNWWESNAIWVLMGNPLYNPNDGWCGI
jgi:hypothetical protein